MPLILYNKSEFTTTQFHLNMGIREKSHLSSENLMIFKQNVLRLTEKKFSYR